MSCYVGAAALLLDILSLWFLTCVVGIFYLMGVAVARQHLILQNGGKR